MRFISQLCCYCFHAKGMLLKRCTMYMRVELVAHEHKHMSIFKYSAAI